MWHNGPWNNFLTGHRTTSNWPVSAHVSDRNVPGPQNDFQKLGSSESVLSGRAPHMTFPRGRYVYAETWILPVDFFSVNLRKTYSSGRTLIFYLRTERVRKTNIVLYPSTAKSRGLRTRSTTWISTACHVTWPFQNFSRHTTVMRNTSTHNSTVRFG